jgi:predicted dehydrogenase
MSTNQVKIGVIGVGHLGRWHVQQLKLIPEAELIGLYDIDPNRSQQIADEFQTTTFTSVEKLIYSCDAVSIVTPTTEHYNYAKQAFAAGRHIFIEKPITATVEQGEEIVNLAESKNLVLQVGHIERFNAAILALENMKIDPLFIESHRLSNFNPRGTDVAVVLDLMIHDIDLILSFVHSPVDRIDASGVSIISPTEDIANCRINFQNGAVANVTASRISTRKMRKMRFFQPNAYISVDFLEGATEVYRLADPASSIEGNDLAFSLGKMGEGENAREIRYTRYEKKDINPLNYELSLFIRAIQSDTPPVIDGRQGVRALRVAKAILQNIEEHAGKVKQNWSIEDGH